MTKVRTFFARHHPVVFISTLCLLLALALFMLYEVLVASSAPAPQSSTLSQFDTKTEDKIKNLRDSDNNTDDAKIVLPSKRPSPFVE